VRNEADQPATLHIVIETGDVAETDPLPITMRLRNVGTERLVLELIGREITFDFILTDEAGRVIWRRLDDSPRPAIVRLVPLEPDGVLELADVWDRRSTAGAVVPPGSYRLTGVVPTSGQPLHAGPIVFEVGGGR